MEGKRERVDRVYKQRVWGLKCISCTRRRAQGVLAPAREYHKQRVHPIDHVCGISFHTDPLDRAVFPAEFSLEWIQKNKAFNIEDP
jgi:hypothetical protein